MLGNMGLVGGGFGSTSGRANLSAMRERERFNKVGMVDTVGFCTS